jgi:SsrA-binding protein
MAGTTKKRRKRNLVEDAEGRLVIATNRRAHRDFDILDRVEAGLVLHGTEVKSLRDGRAQIADAYAYINRGEAWVTGLHISHYEHSSQAANHDPDRRRKLLLHRDQIDRLSSRIDRERLTLVVLLLYFRNNRAKVELGLAKGRRAYDKREAIKRREADLEARRDMARFGRR